MFVFQYVLVKFLEPRQESAGKLGIISIRFYGFVRKSPFMDEEVEVGCTLYIPVQRK